MMPGDASFIFFYRFYFFFQSGFQRPFDVLINCVESRNSSLQIMLVGILKWHYLCWSAFLNAIIYY